MQCPSNNECTHADYWFWLLPNPFRTPCCDLQDHHRKTHYWDRPAIPNSLPFILYKAYVFLVYKMMSDYKPSRQTCYKTAAEDNQIGAFTKSITKLADKIRSSVQVSWINMKCRHPCTVWRFSISVTVWFFFVTCLMSHNVNQGHYTLDTLALSVISLRFATFSLSVSKSFSMWQWKCGWGSFLIRSWGANQSGFL